MVGGQCDDSISPTEEERLGRDEQCTGMLLHGCEDRLEFGVCADGRDMELPPDGANGPADAVLVAHLAREAPRVVRQVAIVEQRADRGQQRVAGQRMEVA